MKNSSDTNRNQTHNLPACSAVPQPTVPPRAALYIHTDISCMVVHGVVLCFQLPCRTGPQTTHSRINEEQNKKCLIQISRYRFSLVISGLTKILQRVNEMVRSSMHFINVLKTFMHVCYHMWENSFRNSIYIFRQ